MNNEQRELVINDLVKFIDRVTNKKRPTKAEVQALPEVVNALRSLTKI